MRQSSHCAATSLSFHKNEPEKDIDLPLASRRLQTPLFAAVLVAATFCERVVLLWLIRSALAEVVVVQVVFSTRRRNLLATELKTQICIVNGAPQPLKGNSWEASVLSRRAISTACGGGLWLPLCVCASGLQSDRHTHSWPGCDCGAGQTLALFQLHGGYGDGQIPSMQKK